MKGYGILLPGGVLAHDHDLGLPFFVKTKRAAERALAEEVPSWARDGARVVKVERSGNTYKVRPC